MNLLTAALRYLDHGLAVIPLWPDRRKNPHLDSYTEFLERLPNKAEWTRWARQWPQANLGIVTGYWLNYVCLDFDEAETYQLWCDGPGFGLKGQTWTVQTGRGYHVWFHVQDEPGKSRVYVKNGDGQAQAGVEVLLRAKGAYCIVPPSVHHTGARYRTVHKVPPLVIDSIGDVLVGWQKKQPKKPKQQRPKRVGMTPGTKTRIEDLIQIPERSNPNARGAYKVHCPFSRKHKNRDSTPSAWLNVEQQRFGCNVCCPGGYYDTVNVYAMLKDISNSRAYAILNSSSSSSQVPPIRALQHESRPV